MTYPVIEPNFVRVGNLQPGMWLADCCCNSQVCYVHPSNSSRDEYILEYNDEDGTHIASIPHDFYFLVIPESLSEKVLVDWVCLDQILPDNIFYIPTKPGFHILKDAIADSLVTDKGVTIQYSPWNCGYAFFPEFRDLVSLSKKNELIL